MQNQDIKLDDWPVDTHIQIRRKTAWGYKQEQYSNLPNSKPKFKIYNRGWQKGPRSVGIGLIPEDMFLILNIC